MAVLLVFHPRALVGQVVEGTGDLGSRRPRFLFVRDAQFLLPLLQGREQSATSPPHSHCAQSRSCNQPSFAARPALAPADTYINACTKSRIGV